MSIITGRGDKGETDLLFGKRIAKTSIRVGVLGDLDEMNAALGLARAAGLSEEIEAIVDRIQDLLVGLMGQLACEPGDEDHYAATGFKLLRIQDLLWVEETARSIEKGGLSIKRGWARPGVEHSLGRAGLDFARTVARRAERQVLALHLEGPEIPEHVRLFFNRISDMLWILARVGPDAPEQTPVD